MAKAILIHYNGDEAQFSHKKIDRSKLYGSRKRIPLGAECIDIREDMWTMEKGGYVVVHELIEESTEE